MTTDKSGIRIKRVSRDKEAGPIQERPVDAGGTEDTRVYDTRSTQADAGHRSDTSDDSRRALAQRLVEDGARETKPFFLTSEFLLTLLTVAALLVASYLTGQELDAWRTWLLVTAVVSAYVLSRGIAKAGSGSHR
jgi:hypothetical protein